MANLTFKTGQLGIPGLSNAERVNAPKQTTTNKSFIKQSPYKNKWDTMGQLIGNSVRLATESFNAVTQYNRAKELKIRNEDAIRKTYIESFKNEASASVTKMLSDEAKENAAIAKTLQENPGKAINYREIASTRLNDFVTKRQELVDKINSDKNFTEKMKKDTVSYVDAILDPLYKSRSDKVLKYTQEDNIKQLNKVAVNRIATEVGNANFSLSNILNGNKANIDAYKANGKDVDTFDILGEAIDMHYDNKGVITSRYNEAKQYLEAGKNITPGFMKYMTKLTKYKNAIKARDKVKDNEAARVKAKEDKKALKLKIATLTDRIFIPPGRDAKTYIADVVNGKEQNDNIKELYSIFKAQGKSDYQIANTLKSAGEYNVIQKTDITDSYKGNVNNVVNTTVKNGLIDRIKTGVTKALETNDMVGLQAMYRANPSVVSKDITNKLQANFFNKVASIKTYSDVQDLVKTFGPYSNFIDKSSKMYKVANILEFANEGNMQKILDVVNGNTEIDYSTIKLPKEVNSKLDSINSYGMRKEAKEYAQTLLFLNPNIDSDTLADKVEAMTKAHTVDLDVSNSMFDKTLSFDSESLKRVNPEYFKDVVSYTMDTYGVSFIGNPYVSYHNGLYVITDSKNPTNIIRIHEQTYSSILDKIKQANEAKVDKSLKEQDKERYINEKGDVKQTLPDKYLK